MKRRLHRAYDYMTMPDVCSQRIENMMQTELEKRQSIPLAGYTQIQAPAQGTGNVWAAAAAVVLLVLTLSVGGVGLLLSLPRQNVQEPASMTSPPETMAPTTLVTIPRDYYEEATTLPASVVEGTAEEIRWAFLEEDWQRLSEYLSKETLIEGTRFSTAAEFVDYMLLQKPGDLFWMALEQETCQKMDCDANGIYMGQARQLRLREENGRLVIADIENMAGYRRYLYSRLEDGTIQIENYVGGQEHVVIPGTIDGLPVTRIGDFGRAGSGAFQDWWFLKTVTIPDSVTYIDDRAFRNCAGLERVDMGAGVTELGNAVFERCPNLTTVCFYGDAPAAGEDVFSESPQVTVYYVDSASGWEEAWQGRPTASRLGDKW